MKKIFFVAAIMVVSLSMMSCTAEAIDEEVPTIHANGEPGNTPIKPPPPPAP